MITLTKSHRSVKEIHVQMDSSNVVMGNAFHMIVYAMAYVIVLMVVMSRIAVVCSKNGILLKFLTIIQFASIYSRCERVCVTSFEWL